MRNQYCYLFLLKNLLDERDHLKIEKILLNVLEPNDFNLLLKSSSGNIDIIVALFEIDKIKLLEKLFSQNGYSLRTEDITQKILNFDFSIELEFIISEDSYNKKIIENFILKNLNLDHVLDKISQFGLNSLNKLERKFLESF